ncbi:MAG: hypothetical protein ACP6KW_08975 [Candidatus Thorarchaeota archaeon]
MADETLSEVASLLEQTLKVHRSVKKAILSTKEGVVVASVSREGDMDPRMLATVSAALVWGSMSTLNQLDESGPSYLVHTTSIERILVIVQPHYQLVVVLSRADDAGLNLEPLVTSFQSIATHMELVMSSTHTFGKQTILGSIVESIPEVSQAILLTCEGLPLGSVGFANETEVAGLVGALFANGLTYSDSTESITVESNGLKLIITRVDESRLLAVVCRGPRSSEIAQKVRRILDGAM